MEDALFDRRLENVLEMVCLKHIIDCLLDHFHHVGIVGEMAADDEDVRVNHALDVVDIDLSAGSSFRRRV